MELVGLMRSYFGGLLCVSWSPDGKYLVVGGEDDLVTVYSFWEKRIVCRGHGHRFVPILYYTVKFIGRNPTNLGLGCLKWLLTPLQRVWVMLIWT